MAVEHRHEAIAPGQSTRSALLRRRGDAVASGLLPRKASDADGVASDAESAVAAASSSRGSPLPVALRRTFERSLGTDLSGVRIHTGAASAHAARAVAAKAYTMGNDIHFGAGRYAPESSDGRRLLAHEVAHTVQQSGGASRMQRKPAVSSPEDPLEHEADRAADAMVSGETATVSGAPGLSPPAMQRAAQNGAAGTSGTNLRRAGRLPIETVYQTYRDYRMLLTIAMGAAGYEVARRKGDELEQQLPQHGFASIPDFQAFIARTETAFEQKAAGIATELLAKYAARLGKESARYNNPREISKLHKKLGGLRKQHANQKQDAATATHGVVDSMLTDLAAAHLHPLSAYKPAAATVAQARAEQVEIQWLARTHPIFREDNLPPEKRIDRAKLAAASKRELGALLQAHIALRIHDIGEAKSQIESKPELIYKMDRLMPQFYLRLGIVPGSVQDMIVRDKKRNDAIVKLVVGITLALLALALTVVSLGTATPAIVAAGAATGSFGIAAYTAYHEYLQYTEEKGLAAAGLVDDPSVAWLVLACVGAAADMAAMERAVRALALAAKQLDAVGDLAAFTRQVEALTGKGIDVKTAKAIVKAAVVRNGKRAREFDFSRSPELLYPIKGKEKNIVRIKYTGSYRGDFKAANMKANLGDSAKPPPGYEWHHVTDYDRVTGEGTLQLVKEEAHGRWHHGGVKQYEQIEGKKYR